MHPMSVGEGTRICPPHPPVVLPPTARHPGQSWGLTYHPLHKSTSQGGPRQDGWESWPVLLQVGNQVRAEWQAGLKRVPDSGSPGPWTEACQAPLSSTISQSLLRFMSIESLMLSNHLILCCLLLFLTSVFPSTRSFHNTFTWVIPFVN